MLSACHVKSIRCARPCSCVKLRNNCDIFKLEEWQTVFWAKTVSPRGGRGDGMHPSSAGRSAVLGPEQIVAAGTNAADRHTVFNDADPAAFAAAHITSLPFQRVRTPAFLAAGLWTARFDQITGAETRPKADLPARAGPRHGTAGAAGCRAGPDQIALCAALARAPAKAVEGIASAKSRHVFSSFPEAG